MADMPESRLTDTDLQQALQQLPKWSVAGGKLHREYKFHDFAHAFGFMAIAAMRIEKMNHHPEWANVYSRVTVDLTTHDSGGITEKDVALARVLEQISGRFA